jgi:hypothetical protein
MMHRILVTFITITLLISSPLSYAAPKSISAVEITKVSEVIDHEGAAISSQGITVFSNAEKKVLINFLDFSGAEIWNLTLQEHADQIVMAATSDREGNIWLAGLTAATVETATPIESGLNVDDVVVEPVPEVRGDLNALTLWKISTTGSLLTTFSESATAPLLINAISHSASGISILGDRGAGSVLVSVTSTGEFSKAVTIGTAKSSFTSIFRNANGSAQIYGSSAESLGGKARVGTRDGILAKVSKSGSLTKVVRSSANRATRNWQSATFTYFLTGEVKVGGKSESAFTKFNSKFSPLWTLRLPSQSSIAAASGPNGSHYALFNSTSAIPRVTRWRPTNPTPLVLRFNAKGVITQAFKARQVKSVRAMSHVSGVGLIIIGASGIFRG